jgi:hypothetical protein
MKNCSNVTRPVTADRTAATNNGHPTNAKTNTADPAKIACNTTRARPSGGDKLIAIPKIIDCAAINPANATRIQSPVRNPPFGDATAGAAGLQEQQADISENKVLAELIFATFYRSFIPGDCRPPLEKLTKHCVRSESRKPFPLELAASRDLPQLDSFS